MRHIGRNLIQYSFLRKLVSMLPELRAAVYCYLYDNQFSRVKNVCINIHIQVYYKFY